MLRSLFSGVSGLRNHQIRLDVIGNNIANVNTIGYKGSRTTFRDVLYQTMGGASAPQGGRGGINPRQVGLGVSIGSIDMIMTGGNTESTGRSTDLAIDGDGFFVLGDDSGATYYTRAGGFSFDEAGNLIAPNGLKVRGWMGVDGVVDPVNTALGFIRIQKGTDLPPSATTEVGYLGNFNRDSAVGSLFTLKKTIFDGQGGGHDLAVTFTKTAANQWNWIVDDAENPDFDLSGGEPGGTISFNPDGSLASWTVGADRVFSQPTQPTAGMADGDWWINTSNGGAAYQYVAATTSWVQASPGTIPAPVALPFPAAAGLADISAFLDFGAFTQYASEGTAIANEQNGYARGSLTEIDVDTSGVITGQYSNGRNRQLAQVALAVFNNPEGLLRVSETTFQASANSGDALVGTASTGGRGELKPGALEMSNVDLSQEFTNLIITQRGFQASSRLITTSDEMLQELVNLKR